MDERVRVKICGIIRAEDARLAISLGAHALGFIFYPQSPRFISPEAAREIVRNLPPLVTTVGVFVNETPERIREIVEAVGLDLVQLHGDEPPEVARIFFPRVIKALRLASEEDLSRIEDYRGCVRGILIEPRVKGFYGGSGKTLDWDLARKAVEKGLPVLLAGGLSPENIREAVERVRPYGVDVNSGVERGPGRKDPEKLRALFRALEGG
ncbi:phosphoribosylanthranilate isomerase [Thermosulfurimonas marina]|uniref:N-(5'-phosphoribosyl)anthranilate isomerase n=1 Tax=Thermosulfurimonas marina TaxID=2047767 RepID=A0A6H1WSJ2_9BACT|nr:phosphoribosylanthranilate isomerase [Thermosulfurimonas marina]QJA06152.1 phosphoribosylanthranilate isomerase [Thermosulfurimonas marina]